MIPHAIPLRDPLVNIHHNFRINGHPVFWVLVPTPAVHDPQPRGGWGEEGQERSKKAQRREYQHALISFGEPNEMESAASTQWPGASPGCLCLGVGWIWRPIPSAPSPHPLCIWAHGRVAADPHVARLFGALSPVCFLHSESAGWRAACALFIG